MKKTVVFEFPDDFKFPKRFTDEGCKGCPLKTEDGQGDVMCFITEEGDYPLLPSKLECPFYDGAESVNFN